MKKIFLASIFLVNTIAVSAQNSQEITKEEALKYVEASSEYFTGKANFAPLPKIPSSNEAYAIVNFEAGTINNWHTHSHGQYMVVTQGEGRVQEWGKPIQIIKKGDVIWCPPHVKHWHGAGEHTAMSHLVIVPNAAENKVEWLEKVELPKSENHQNIVENEVLTGKRQAIVSIAALTAMGKVEKLSPALENALKQGLSISEIKEIFTHIQAYVGFPRALNGLSVFNELLKTRTEKGIIDQKGAEPKISKTENYYELGERTLRELGNGRLVNGEPLFGSEGMDYALKANLFGYLFSRENLSFVDREIVVVSALSVLEGVEGQLASHLRTTNNLGLSKNELNRLITIVKRVNSKQAKNAEKVLNNIIKD